MESYKVQSHNCTLQVYSINSSLSKTTMLFLHGGPGSGAKAIMDLPAFENLSKNFHCLYFDQRGSGNSKYDLSQGLNIKDITEDVYEVIMFAKKQWNIEYLYLWGGSFGGYLACLCLEKFPKIFQGAILSSPAITFNREQALCFYKNMSSQYQKKLSISNTLSHNSTPEKDFAIPEFQQFVFSPKNPSQSLKHICAMSSWFYLHPMNSLFDHIEIPLLVMQGTDDPICFYQNIDEVMQNRKTHITYYLYENCGHEVFTDCMQEFQQRIIEFIQKNNK